MEQGAPVVRWHQPHPSFAAHVRRIAGFTGRASGSQCRTELPAAGVTLILGFGDRIRISSATGSGMFTSFLAGLHEIPVDTEHSGTLSCLQIDLTPLGAYRLLGMPMSDLADTVVDVGQLRRPGWRDLAEQLADSATWTDRFRLVERAWAAGGRTGRPRIPRWPGAGAPCPVRTGRCRCPGWRPRSGGAGGTSPAGSRGRWA
ncbi:DUF6597 domain-containing transcriptional factor [Pseudonocardia spinosispora]|uniref:DUF6597 domain-containing transcriptional factor n=1 Tax=Pseudonocardia spinosispora TaxID=103441 RepID=UPI00040691AE|nr:DUF6597 domain-containing transcriptional factor [Pseudonocardia spinosispora]